MAKMVKADIFDRVRYQGFDTVTFRVRCQKATAGGSSQTGLKVLSAIRNAISGAAQAMATE